MSKIFSKDIYKQTIKKLGFVTILTAIVSIMVTLVIISMNFGSNGQYMPVVFRYYYVTLYSSNGFTAAGLAPFLVAVMFIGSVLFTYITFNYQNKRALSDKYHSLPYTRVQQYVSRILAILTLLYAIIILTLLTSYIAINISNILFIPKYYILSALGYMAGTTLIVAVTATAMSITGNLFANLTVTTVLLFVPRSILFMVSMLINRVSHQMVSVNDLNVLLSPSTNIPVGIVLDVSSLWTYNGTSGTLISARGIIFTFVLAAVYLAAALYLSNRRKSELAGKSFISPAYSYIFASLCALPIVALSGYVVATSYIYGKSALDVIRGQAPAFIVFAVVLFVVIAIIYNTRAKGLVKGITIFIVISLLGYAMIAGGVAMANGLTHKQINGDKVEYVNVNLAWDKQYTDYPVYTYGIMMAKDIKIYDKDLINSLIENYEIAEQEITDDPLSVYYQYNRSRRADFWCEFHMESGHTVVRNIPVYGADTTQSFIDMLLSEKDFYNALYMLPESDEVSSIYCEGPSIDIYDLYLSELKRTGVKSYEALPNYLSDNNSVYNYLSSGSVTIMTIKGMHNGDAYITNLPISSYVPETKREYLKQNALIFYDELINVFDDLITSKDTPMQLSMSFRFGNYEQTQVYYNSLEYRNEIINENFDYDTLIKLIKDLRTVDIDDFDDNDYYFSIDYSLHTDNGARYAYTYLPLDEEMYNYWMALANNTQ